MKEINPSNSARRKRMSSNGMRVLALDPGFDRLGVAIIEKENNTEQLIHSACVETQRSEPFSKRLVYIGNAITQLLTTYKPEALAIETLYFTKNKKTAMQVAETRGVAIYLAQKAGLLIFEYTPLQVKVAVTGDGKADKKQVATMVEKLLSIRLASSFDDEYDAVAIGLTCFARERF